jgi:hypothetical protein
LAVTAIRSACHEKAGTLEIPLLKKGAERDFLKDLERELRVVESDISPSPLEGEGEGRLYL